MWESKFWKFYNFVVFSFLVILAVPSDSSGQLVATSHPHPTGYTTGQVQWKNAMYMDQNDNILMGYRDIGLGIYDGTNWVMYDSLSSGLPSNNILSVGVKSNGNIWAGTMLGASLYDGFSWNTFNTLNSGLPSNKINALNCESPVTWFGTDNGISGFDGTNWVNYNSASGLIYDTVTAVMVTPNGTLWVGTMKGLSKFENNVWTSYDSTNSNLPTYLVTDLEYDNYGNVWVSTYGQFMITSSGQILNALTDVYQDEFPISPVGKVKFAKDINGRIYFRGFIGTKYYIYRFDNFQFDAFKLPQFNQGVTAYGHLLEIDSDFQLYYNSKIEAGSYLTSFDMNTYQEPPIEYVPFFDNYKNLDINDVSALMLNRGDMHWDISNSKYEVPKGSGKHPLFASGLWIGGLDAGGIIHLAAQTYRQSGHDYWPGPIEGISIPFDSVSCHQYDKIWKVSKWEVEAFKNNFADGSISNGTSAVPEFFLSWPAKGNNFITDDKAPFFDYNGDNLYNPYDGDYPLIKGDQMLFWMFNDSLAIHTSSDGEKLGMEVHASAYAFSCPGVADSNSVLNTTTLYNYRFINRSPNNYSNFYSGLWCDGDLGNNVDDYIGCDSMLAAGFVYNGDNDDETFMGYGLNPPMQNVVVLKGHNADPGDGIDNDLDGTVDEPVERTTMNHFHTYMNVNNLPFSNPGGFLDYYRYMQSIWQNGDHVTYGGSIGYNSSTTLTNFIYSGTPYDTSWTESNVGNQAEDRRFVLSSGPVSFPAGGEHTIDFAYVFTRDSLNPNGLTTSVARNIADVQRVKSWFDNDNFPSCLIYSTGLETTEAKNLTTLKLEPNPASSIIRLEHNLEYNSELNYVISDLAGRTIESGKVSNDEIFLKNIPEGLYILNINNNTQQAFARFVKVQ